MKTIKLVVALTGLSIATFGSSLQVSAATCNSDSNQIETPALASQLLVNGQDKSFILFMETSEESFTKKQEWRDFLEVLSLYNQNSEKFCKQSIEKRVIFADAIKTLQLQLAKQNSKESLNWNKKVAFTASTFNFIWNFNATPTVITPEESEVEVIHIDTVVSSL